MVVATSLGHALRSMRWNQQRGLGTTQEYRRLRRLSSLNIYSSYISSKHDIPLHTVPLIHLQDLMPVHTVGPVHAVAVHTANPRRLDHHGYHLARGERVGLVIQHGEGVAEDGRVGGNADV